MAVGFQPVVSLWRHRAAKAAPVRDWTQDELAQFYRVEWALGQAGISVETERGLSDEGDPWFAFCKANDGDVVIHIAREGPVYVLAGVLSGGVQRGRDFASLVEQLLAQHPAKSIDRRNRGNVIMHPATMLALLVSIAILQSGGESKAAGEDGDSAHSALLKQHGQGHAPGAAAPTSVTSALLTTTAGRVSQATAASPTPLVATLEVAQAMSILMVASLATQEPARASTLIKSGDGEGLKLAALQTSFHDRAPLNAGSQQAGKDMPVQSNGGQSDAKSLSDGQAGVEKLLEIVAKLWTMPTAAVATSTAMSVESALAFFKGDTPEPTSAMITIAAPQPKTLPVVNSSVTPEKAAPPQTPSAPVVETAIKDVKEVKAVAETKPAEAKETLQIVHTPAGSETTAQTVLKLSVANVKEQTIETGSASDSGKLLAAVSEIVSLAKATQSLDSAKSAMGKSLDLDLGKQSSTKTDVLKTDDGNIKTDDVKISKADDANDSAADLIKEIVKVPEIVSTTTKTGMVKHDVLDDSAIKTTIDKAVAAFYDDVAKVSVAITGKDIIYYSADAVINHSTEVVVELWQFKDGSSISLVGLSHDGLLPYSL